MNLKDLPIGTQLRLSLGLILTIVVVLAALAWTQTDTLWLQTKGLYEHPLQVRMAIGALEVDILALRGEMKSVALAENDQDIAMALEDINLREADALRQFTVLYDRYLGPSDDVRKLHDEFVTWKTLREETLRLLRDGWKKEAFDRIKGDGIGGGHAKDLIKHIDKISDFARNKGDQFYQDAETQRIRLSRQLGFMVLGILLLSLVVAWILLKGIKGPLVELTLTANQFRQGMLDSRSRYTSANEFGTLSASFNSLADTVQREIAGKESAARLAGVMLQEEEVHGFCRELLKALLAQTGSQIGAVYFLNASQTTFELFASIGLAENAHATFSATELSGEFGAALATRQIQHITDIPADTRFSLRTVVGDFSPREILTIPILADHHVSAVISLAAVHALSEAALRLVSDIWSVLNARLNGVLAFRKIQDLAEKLDQQNRELDAQKSELAAQTSELTEQNSELEMQSRQLNEANRLKSAFLSNMSHELRTPLNSVIVLSGLLNRRLAKAIPEEEYSYLEIIERNGKNLLKLINDILDLSRIEAGCEELSVSRFSVRDLTAEIVAMLEPLARDKGIELHNLVDKALAPIATDADKCRHILQNLAANALKFTEHGEVTISARQGETDIHISVADTGIGIAADHLATIFEEFRQADDSTSRKYGGTGLGLAIAKKYAVLLGGEITVTSSVGQGSTFTLQLPLALPWPNTLETATAEVSGKSRSGPPSVSSGENLCILLVEDSEPAIMQMKDILHDQGYRVTVARNGREALAEIEKNLPDAMILDLMMPEVDGFQVLGELRSDKRTAQLPVLILTAKHVTREELSFLKGNHIYQLIQKGGIDRVGLLAAVTGMVAVRKEVPPPQRVHRPSRSGKPVVLVVEDNPDNLRTARALLQENYQVIEATDGRAGIDQARLHRPDLILTDIAMPVMDGLQALEEIRQDQSLRHIPVVAVTSSAMSGDREAILAHGFDGYISKPIDPELLARTMREMLSEGNEPVDDNQDRSHP